MAIPEVHKPSEEEKAQFDERLAAARAEPITTPERWINNERVIWSPLPGSQTRFMQCPIQEALFHGTRGPGKTDSLLMDYAQHVGRGHSAAWRGILFRQTYPQLADVQAKSEKWFRLIFPGAKFNKAKMMWEWDTGEALLFRHMNRAADYWNYHGHEYPWIGWEEITNWASDECYRSMFSCNRSSVIGVPRRIRATTNPYGPGHSWVKDRFDLTGQWWKTVIQMNPTDADGNAEPPRVAIHGHIDENTILLKADPTYKQTIVASAANPAMAEAWLDGSWDIVAGGMFQDVWDAEQNIVTPFEVPHSWRIDRSFDWGSSKPFSVGWWAESDGSDLYFKDGSVMSTVKGDMFRIKEWYGWNGHPNQGLQMLAVDVAKGIVERELLWGFRNGDNSRVKPGPADSSIYDIENGVSIGQDMEKPIRIGNLMYRGVSWTRADKRPGSRKAGWEKMRSMMRNAWQPKGLPRENPGVFVVGLECKQFLRTVTTLPRDEKDMDDVDTNAEDHIGDEARYRLRATNAKTGSGRTTGMY